MCAYDLAHISGDGRREQTVAEHLLGTAELAAGFGTAFGAEEEARLAGLLHDIGKCSDAFQARLRGGPRCDHSTAGTQEAMARQNLPVAFAVAGHHGGLPDGGAKGDTADDPTLMGRSRRKVEDYSRFAGQILLPGKLSPSRATDGPRETASFRTAFYTRMLFSCLVDADWLDTEAFMDGTVERGMNRPIPEVLERFDAFLRQKGWDSPARELDTLRWDILCRCRDLGTLETGLFTLTVPAGGGKTGTSMAFALEQASGKERKNALQLLSEIVSDGNVSLCDDALELAGENGRTDVDSLRQCYYMIAKKEYRPNPLKLSASPVLNYNPNLSVYDGLMGGDANVRAD